MSKLPHALLKKLKLRILANEKILGKIEHSISLVSSLYSKKEKIGNSARKLKKSSYKTIHKNIKVFLYFISQIGTKIFCERWSRKTTFNY